MIEAANPQPLIGFYNEEVKAVAQYKGAAIFFSLTVIFAIFAVSIAAVLHAAMRITSRKDSCRLDPYS